MNTAQANEPPPTQEFPLNEIKRPGLIAANNNNVPHLRSPSFWRNKKAANMSIQKRLLQKKLLKWVAIPTAIAVLLGLIIFLAVWFGALHRVSSSSPSTSILYIAPPINYKICILFIALSANNGIEYKLNQNASEYALLPSLSASWISAQSFGRISLSGIVNTTSYADVFDWVNVTVSSIDCNQYQDWANQAAQSILHNNVYNLILLITSGKDNCGVIYPSTSSNIALASYSYILSTPLIFGKLLASMTNFIGSADNTLNCLDYTQRSSPLTTSSENCNSVQLMDCTDIVNLKSCKNLAKSPKLGYINPLNRVLAGILPYQWIKNSSSANGVNEWYTETIILRSLTALGNVSLGEFALVNISMDTPIATSDLSIRNQKYLYIENRNGTILFKSSGSIFTTSQNNFTIDTSSFFHLRKNLSVPGDVYYDVPQDVQVVLWFTNYTSSAINITYRFSDSPQFKTAIIPSLTPSSPQTMSFAVYPIDFSFNGLTKGTAASDPRSFILNSHQYGWKPILDRASGGAFVSKGLLSPGDALDVFPWIINSITPTACKPTDNQYTIWDYQSQIVSDYETLYNLNFASELSYSNYDAVLLMFPENCQTDRPGEAGQAYVRGQLDVQDGGTIGLTSMVPVSSVGIKNATNLEYSWIVLHEMYGHAAFGFMHTSVMICLSKTDFSSCNSSISFDGEYYMDYGGTPDSSSNLRKVTPFDRELAGMIFPPYLKNIKYTGSYQLADYGDVPYITGKVYVFKMVLKHPLTYKNTEGSGSTTVENFVQIYMHSVNGVVELFAGGPIGYYTHTARITGQSPLTQPGAVWSNTVEGWTITYVSYMSRVVTLSIQM